MVSSTSTISAGQSASVKPLVATRDERGVVVNRLIEAKPAVAEARRADAAEFSDRARALSEASRPIRHDLVARVREEIRAGTYESEGKLDYVARRISRELDITG